MFDIVPNQFRFGSVTPVKTKPKNLAQHFHFEFSPISNSQFRIQPLFPLKLSLCSTPATRDGEGAERNQACAY
jgi:hypothetical protein